ncbi:MAG: hypothetical protein IJE26_07745 [Oscillospiraceae bacterium]|nr:hypothetical protein [Oscillospiraceae bacterium]
MGLFTKKEMDTAAAERFWQWFSENEEQIIEALAQYDMGIVRRIDEQLAPVFPYYKNELEFQLGFQEGQGEFIFFHLGNKHLQRHSAELREKMPPALRERWHFSAED